jgi:hypothetical protein
VADIALRKEMQILFLVIKLKKKSLKNFISFLSCTCFLSISNPIFGFRDALLAYFPGKQHLMCYFHVKQACQVKLRASQ